jgi:hypothetical protein
MWLVYNTGINRNCDMAEARDCQVLIQLQIKHTQNALQWIPRHCQIAGNEHADTLAKKGAKILQTHSRETSYHSIKLHLKQVFQRAYIHELQIKLSQKPWRQEIANTPDWPRRKAVAEFRVWVRHDCLGTHLHRVGIHPDPFYLLCSLREPMDRNHLGQCAALTNGTECERYREAIGQKWWKTDCAACLLLLPLLWLHWSRRAMINNQCNCL